MDEKKKKGKEKQKLADGDPVMYEFSDFVLESLEQISMGDLETIDNYAARLRAHVHSDPKIFRSRFLKGYDVLLDTIAHHKP